ncbi:MAG: bifunctional DNA-formamidopyrimidine glycosylase/DNA-(apurinic or apyrimidinic site) lyase [Proteobacteria bacterium]|nr:bifunctional DNA-formamidopyrimidine glycosylase/DNA-(apurinic or apyrimidinic site) lyase [Pseudomonadota bacterium]NCA28568.1 bifunctional DNA-formamidopyrimidine glycosylase/DNA-(apurinic or apyrimidinic site) lyase [Pseudomonadota bacterium]
MPELPEIETIKLGIQSIKNLQITQIYRSNHRLRIDSTLDLSIIKTREIIDISRRARYLIIKLSNQKSLIIHLGMSGRITLSPQFHKLKHDHFACQFNSGKWLIYNDPRRFGFIDLINNHDIKNHKMLKSLGPEPLSTEFNSDYLAHQIANKNINIKTLMMDNKIVVGVGNIYINESLFDAKISPLRSAKSLHKNEVEKLTTSIKKIIGNAIDMGGSSISDYQNAQGEFGSFQTVHRVYDRSNQKCFLCNCNIERIVQNQRSSFFCKKCQK